MGLCLLLFIIGIFGLFFLIKKGDLTNSTFITSLVTAIVAMSFLCSVCCSLSCLEQYLKYSDTSVRVLDKHNAYCEIAKDPILSAIFIDEIDVFNRNIQTAKRHDSFFMRWAFVSPAYALVDEIERSE